MSCHCYIIPEEVLRRFAADRDLDEAKRKGFTNTIAVDRALRRVRDAQERLTKATFGSPLSVMSLAPAAPPVITVSNCNHNLTLPGVPIATPATNPDATIKRAFAETQAVADFYQRIFGRNSLDGNGLTLNSSVHYGSNYNNAFWNGARMAYGDGDGSIFTDFTQSNDVIAHELTHGITQYTLQLAYTDEAGGLNESMSDVFGSMFRQWRRSETVSTADWLIGKDILGAQAQLRFNCLRNLANPADVKCLAPQPMHFRDYTPGMDPHYSSGIPNHAFYKAATQYGGNSWGPVGQVWFRALIQGLPVPNMRMAAFADRTRHIAATQFAVDAKLLASITAGWAAVGL